MQRTTALYKKSMKEPLRGQSYMMVTFGLINQEVQAHATLGSGEMSYLASPVDAFDTDEKTNIYVGLDEGFTRVDGNMYFPPKPESALVHYPQGIISADIVPETGYSIVLNFNTVSVEVKGLTLNFGDIYAVDFDIESASGQKIEIRGNDKSEFVTQEVIEETNYIKLTFYKMKNNSNRLRLYSILFGFGLIYKNEDIIEADLESYVSAICEDIPQYDFNLKLKNYDRYFDVDNPDSAINFIETGQQMGIMYGYKPIGSDTIEWIPGQTLFCSSWSSDDSSVTIECQDVFRGMDGEYFRGIYNESGVSYYDLAEKVFAEAGVVEYEIDPYLKTIKTHNPIPRVSYKEALQIISNACRCVLSQTRGGISRIQTSFVPDYHISTDGKETAYSDILSAKIGLNMLEYTSFATNYMTANGTMVFPPRTWVKANTGYVSSQQSDSSGNFTEKPYIMVDLEAAYNFVGFNLVFGSSLPSKMTVTTYLEGELRETVEITEGIQTIYKNDYEFLTFDQLKITFDATLEPNNRIVLLQFAFGDITNFIMERNDILDSPTSIKQELVKNVRVAYYVYHKGTAETSITSEERTVANGDIASYFFDEPAYDYRATFSDNASSVEILESADYYVKVKFKTSGRGVLNIYGHKYNVTEQYVEQAVHNTGKTITWKNPLLSDKETAVMVAEWLGNYYTVDVEYEYKTRGNPEIDANDIIYQENAYDPELQVTVYRSTTHFSQGISGNVEARRVKKWN